MFAKDPDVLYKFYILLRTAQCSVKRTALLSLESHFHFVRYYFGNMILSLADQSPF